MVAKTMSEVKEWFEGLAKRVDAAGGVLSVQMGELRDGLGAGRLDKGPIARIEATLDGAGLRSIPLDSSANTYVLVYKTNSPIAKIIDSVSSYQEDADKALVAAVRAYSGESDPRDEELVQLREVITQVRAIVSEV